jgi:hypothetical protein
MDDFRDILDHCEVHDLGFIGVLWTFNNNQHGLRNVKVRLDRVVATSSWSGWFLGVCVRHLITSRSDHLPILLDMDRDGESKRNSHISRYEVMWEHEQSLMDEIRTAWGGWSCCSVFRRCGWKFKNCYVILEMMEQGKVWCAH